MIQINVNTSGEITDVPYIRSDSNQVYTGHFDPNYPWRCIFQLPTTTPPAGWGASINWDDRSERFIVPAHSGSYEGELLQPIPINTLDYPPPIPPLPPEPSREDVCGVNLTFQGLVVNLSTGSYPWFELGFQCQNEDDRARVYEAKHINSDTHLILQFMNARPVYSSSDEQPYNNMFSPDFESDPVSFYNLVREVIVNGFIPIVSFDGDNADNSPYGSANALRQIPILANLLRDLQSYILFARLWDGVFYGSDPHNIENFGTQFRQYLPDGYLGIMHNEGHIPVGGGPADYNGGRMRGYDMVFSQFGRNLSQDSTWQIAARLLGSSYKRPADQPSWDDPTPPFYLLDSSRGPRYACALEWVGEYLWVRNRTTPHEIAEQRSYLKSIGYRYIG